MNKSIIVSSFFNASKLVDHQINHVTDDSREVHQGSLFVARKGVNSHGISFIEEALSNGATCIISDKPKSIVLNIPFIYEQNLEKVLLSFLCKFYNLNLKKFLFHGVTGTNGKTSTAFMAHHIIRKLDRPSCFIGTIGTIINDELRSTKGNSTPGIFELFTILDSIQANQKTFIFLELSSHALDQDRLLDLPFVQTILVNIESDHLDYHLSLENYIKTKLSLLDVPSQNLPIVNIDSSLVKSNLDFNGNAEKLNFLSHQDSSVPFAYKIIFNSLSMSSISFNYPDINIEINTSLYPYFNIENLAFAIALISKSITSKDLQSLQKLEIPLPPGRSEVLELDNGQVFIDFAHDPQAIRNILSALKESYDEIVLVFGCGGERDKSKRPHMMKAASEFSNVIFFTSDNSRNELFSSIAKDAMEGCDTANVEVIEDREEAIKSGLKLLNNNNILVILGKGHEIFLEVEGKKIPFNDRECVLRNVRL